MFQVQDMEIEKILILVVKVCAWLVDTENYTYGALFNEINENTGGIMCGVEVFDDAKDPQKFTAMFSVRGKALYPKYEFLFSMIREILCTSKLTDTKRLYEIIAQIKSRAQASLVSAGHQTAVLRGSSYGSPDGLHFRMKWRNRLLSLYRKSGKGF